MDFREQWEKVDWNFFKQFVELHNAIALERKKEDEFDKFVLENKEKLNNPDYLQIFVERINLHAEYYEKHFDMCLFFFNFIKNNPDWEKLNFGLRTFLRLGIFRDTFQQYLEQQKMVGNESFAKKNSF